MRQKRASRNSDVSREQHGGAKACNTQGHAHDRAAATLEHTGTRNSKPRQQGSTGAAGGMHGSSDAMRTQQTPERPRRGAHNSSKLGLGSPLRFNPPLFQPSPGHGASPAQQYLDNHNDLINLFQSPQRPVADAAALDLLLAATPGSTPLQAKGSMFSPSPAPRSRASSGGRPRARAVSLEAVGWDLRGQQQGAAGSSLGGLPPGLLGPEGAEPGIQDMVSDLLRSPSAKDTPRRMTRSLSAAVAALASPPSGAAGTSAAAAGADASSLTPLVGSKLQRRRCLDFSRAGGGHSSSAGRQVRAFKSEAAAATGPSAMISCQPTPPPLQQQQPQQQRQQQQPAPPALAIEAPTLDHLLLPEALAAAADVVAGAAAGQMDSPDARGGLGPVLTLLGRGGAAQLMSPPAATSTTRLAAGSSTLLTPISRRLQLPRHREGAGGSGAAGADAEEASPAGDDLDLLPLLPLQPGGSQQEGGLLEALSPGPDALPDAEQQVSSKAGAQDASAIGATVSRVMRRGARKTQKPPQQQQQQQEPLPGSPADAPHSAAGGHDMYNSDSHPVYNCVKGLRSRGRTNSGGSGGGAPDGSHRAPLQPLQAPNSSSKRSSRARKRSLKYAAALLAEQGYVEEEQEGYDRELALQCEHKPQQQQQQQQQQAQAQQQQQQQEEQEQGPAPDMFAVAAAAGAALPALDGNGYCQPQEAPATAAAAAAAGGGGATPGYGDLPWSSQQAVKQEGHDHAASGPADSMAVCSDWEEEEYAEQEEQDDEPDSQDAPDSYTATRSRSKSRGRGRAARARGRSSASRQRGMQGRAVQAVQVMPPRRSSAAGGGAREPSPSEDGAYPLAGLRPPPMEDLHVAVQQGRRSCRCKKSLCLKLYCECFAAGVYCFACSCRSCHNTTQHQAEVTEQRLRIMQRDPDAFSTKLRPDQPSSRKGCNCRKSHCLKKYCDCFQMGVRCSGNCKCSACENTEELLGPSEPPPPPASVPAAPVAALTPYAGTGASEWVAGVVPAGLPVAVEAAGVGPGVQPSMVLPVGMTPGAEGATPVSATPQVVDLGPAMSSGPGTGSGAGATSARQQLFRRGGDVQAPGQGVLGGSGVGANLADRFEQAVKQEPGLQAPGEQVVKAAHPISRGTARVLAAARELAPRLYRSAAGANNPSSASKAAAMGAPQIRHSSSGGATAGVDAGTPTRLQTPDQQTPWPASCTPSSRSSSCDGGGATTAAAAWAAAMAAGEGGVGGAGRGRHRLSTSSSEGAAQGLQLASLPEGAGLMPPPSGRPAASSRQAAEAMCPGLAEQQQADGRLLMECDETVPADLEPVAMMGAAGGVSSEGLQLGALHQRLTPLKRKLEADGEDVAPARHPQQQGSATRAGGALLATPGSATPAAGTPGAASTPAQLDASMLQDMRLVYIADTQCLALVPASALQGVLGTSGTAAVQLPVGTPGLRTPGSAGGPAAARGATAGDGRVVYSGQLLGAPGRGEASAPHIPLQPPLQQQRAGWIKPEPGATPQHVQRAEQLQQRSLSSSTPPAATAPHGRLLHCPSSLTPSASLLDATPPPAVTSATAGQLLGNGPYLPLQMQQVGSPALGPGPLQLLKAGANGQGFASPPPAGMTPAQQVLSPNGGHVVSPTGGRMLFRFSPGPTRLTPAEQP